MYLDNVRLYTSEKIALQNALQGINEEIYLYGSRLDKTKRGGDIDLLVYSKKNSFQLSQEIRRKFFLNCEEKIDVLVLDKDNLSEEQQAFVNTLKLIRIK